MVDRPVSVISFRVRFCAAAHRDSVGRNAARMPPRSAMIEVR